MDRELPEGGTARWLQHDAPSPIPTATRPSCWPATRSTEDWPEPPAVTEADAVLMLYTAAFTGTPNGALLSHVRPVPAQALMMANLQRIDADYRYLNCGPLFHVATFMTTLATLVMGGTNLFTPRVDAEELCRGRSPSAEGCTGAFAMRGSTIDQIIELNAPDGTQAGTPSTCRRCAPSAAAGAGTP